MDPYERKAEVHWQSTVLASRRFKVKCLASPVRSSNLIGAVDEIFQFCVELFISFFVTEAGDLKYFIRLCDSMVAAHLQ